MKKNKGENNIINNIIKLLIILVGIIIQIILLFFLYGATSTLKEYATISFEIIKFIAAIYIIYKRQNPAYKIIWIILLMIMPVAGLVAYILWGNNKTPKKTKLKMENENKISKKLLIKNEKLYELKDENRKKEAEYIYNVSKYPMYNNETTEYFESGEKCYKKIKEDIINAKEYILIEFFILSNGKMWKEIYEILKQKTKEGVKVYLIYDSLGSLFKKPRHLNEQLKEINVNYISFNKPTPLIRSYINFRDHRKIIVIDGLVAYTGGINIGDEYINLNSKLGYWKDSCARITGESIKSFIVMFFKIWNLNTKDRINYKKLIEKIEITEINNGYIIPYEDSPQNKKNPAQNTYINIINNAKKYIYIMTPYLVLDSETEKALINASYSGIDVRIMTPRVPDKKLVHACTKSFYGGLLESGIKIYEYNPGFIHSKIIVSDDNVATVGTTNFDFRSFYLNYECGIWMYNTKTEKDIKQDFIDSIEKCDEIKLNVWKNRKLTTKIVEAILRLISPLL